MTIQFLGHACFLFEDSKGTRIVIDPYEPEAFGGGIGYDAIDEEADVVLVSHEHADHNYVRAVAGTPTVCRGSCSFAGIVFKAIPALHDETGGSKRGGVNIFVFKLDGITLCHLSDLGELLSAEQVAQIGDIDVLMVPVGGTYTINAEQAWAVVQQLNPRIVIPMHFKTAKVSLPIAPLGGFLNDKPGVTRVGGSVLELSQENLGEELRIIALEPAM